MSEENSEEYGEIQDGLVQLRFADKEGNIKDINAAEMSQTLQGLVEFTSQLAKDGVFGSGLPPEVRVRPPKEGSFVIEALIQWAGESPQDAVPVLLASGGSVVQAINVGVRRLKGEKPKNFEHLDNGNVKVVWQNDFAQEIPSKAWEKLNSMKRPTRTALRKIMAPLSDDVDVLEVRDGSPDTSTAQLMNEAPAVVIGKDVYRAAAAEPTESEPVVEIFDAEAQIEVVDFRPGEKWLVKTLRGRKKAEILDEDFLTSLDRGMSLHKNDIFDVTIRETRTIKNERIRKEWKLLKVVRKHRGGGDDDSPSSRAANGTSHPSAD